MTSKRQRQAYKDVVLAAPVSVPYERYSIETAHWWFARALGDVTQKAGLRPGDLDGLSIASFSLAPDSAVGLTQHLGLSPRWLDHIPMGGASGIVALRRAARAVESGDASIVACVAADANHVNSFRELLSGFSRFSEDATYPYGYGGPNSSFALLTHYYMRTFGASREDFGKLCIDQRNNALTYPHALMKKPLTMEQYLSARPIADPIHLFDCVMPCAGAEAFIVTTSDVAEDLGLPYARLLSTIERHNSFQGDPIQFRGGWAVDATELYALAALSPKDIDVVQTYDDYPVMVMMQLEDLGFCEKGEGPEFVRSHSFTSDGSFPQNTCGGQLSAGQAGAAGGFLCVVEGIRQVTGQSLSRQVPHARTALVSGFGMINYDRGVCTGAAIFQGSR